MFFIAFSFNPPNGKTGAPGEGYCVDCHQPGPTPLSGDLSIEGLSDTLPSGSLIDLQIKIKSISGSPLRAGFQLVILDTVDQNFGELLNPGDSCTVQLDPGTGRYYAEHDQKAKLFTSDSTVCYSADWLLPADRVNEIVRFYAVSMLANGNGNNSGDKMITFRRSIYVKESITSFGLAESENAPVILYPTISNDWITVEWNRDAFAPRLIILFNLYGAIQKTLPLEGDDSNIVINISEMPSGIYFIRVISRHQKATLKLFRI